MPSLIVLAAARGSTLLRPTILRAYPPVMARYAMSGEWFRDGFSWDDMSEVVELGLPVWWDNALVEEGWDRLRRRLNPDLPSSPTLDEVLAASALAVERGLATRVDTQN